MISSLMMNIHVIIHGTPLPLEMITMEILKDDQPLLILFWFFCLFAYSASFLPDSGGIWQKGTHRKKNREI